MFLGEYYHTLDSKGRVVMPSGFRRRLEEGCVVAKGQDGQLTVHATEDFLEKASEVMGRPQDKEGRRFSRTVFAGADAQVPDKSGRVLLKEDLREYAGLELASEVAVIGVFTHVEIWNRDGHTADRAAGDEMYLEEDD